MSHYAKIVEPVSAIGVRSDFAGVLPVGTPIKRVRVVLDGYLFKALWLGTWIEMTTTADLPAATDKGQAYRAARAKRATLRQGRPTVSTEPATVRLVCKVTEAQAEAVADIAAKDGFTVPRFIRHLLMKAGMPE